MAKLHPVTSNSSKYVGSIFSSNTPMPILCVSSTRWGKPRTIQHQSPQAENPKMTRVKHYASKSPLRINNWYSSGPAASQRTPSAQLETSQPLHPRASFAATPFRPSQVRWAQASRVHLGHSPNLPEAASKQRQNATPNLPSIQDNFSTKKKVIWADESPWNHSQRSDWYFTLIKVFHIMKIFLINENITFFIQMSGVIILIHLLEYHQPGLFSGVLSLIVLKG